MKLTINRVYARQRTARMLLGGCAMIGLIAVSATVQAQSATAVAADEAAPDSAAIVVTARRTSERLDKVPIAVAAFGTEALAERNIQSQADLQFATPGLTVRQTGSSDQLNYSIRGQSIDAFSFSAPAVASYFNDVPVGGASATAFFDLESIQVLKGPQGTLFGRNATGGAVLYGSAKPKFENSGYVKGGYGNFNNTELEGAINIGGDSGIALRLAGKVRKRDGTQHNLLDNTNPNSIDSQVGRASLLIEPSGSRFSNLLVVQYGHFGGLTGGTKIANANGVNGTPSTYFNPITNSTKPLVTNMRDVYGAGGPGAGVVPGFTSLDDFLTKQASIGFYDFYGNQNSKRRGTQTLITNTTTFELNDDLTITNIAGYNRVLNRENTDIDGSPYSFLVVGGGPGDKNQGYTFGTKQWSEELQVSGKSGSLKYIFGGFLSHEDTYNRIPLAVTPDLGAPFLGPYDFTATNKSSALYGQLTFALTDRLNLNGGLRYTWEKVSLLHGADSLLNVLNAGIHTRKDSKPSWLLGIDYRLAEGLMVYFNQRGSWRTGGFNGTSAASFPNAPTFKPETTYDFEGGIKYSGSLGAMRTHLNLAVYDQVIKNVQRAPYLNISALAGNVNKAEVTGVEIDGSIEPTSWMEIGGAYTFTNARYTDPRATVAGANFIFGPYADTPRNSGSAYVRLTHDLGDNMGSLVYRAEVYAQSQFYYSNLNQTIVPNALIPGYSLVNMRAEWKNFLGKSVDLAAYVSNLTNKEYYTGGFPLGAVVGANSRTVGTPRVYGLEIGVKF